MKLLGQLAKFKRAEKKCGCYWLMPWKFKNGQLLIK